MPPKISRHRSRVLSADPLLPLQHQNLPPFAPPQLSSPSLYFTGRIDKEAGTREAPAVWLTMASGAPGRIEEWSPQGASSGRFFWPP